MPKAEPQPDAAEAANALRLKIRVIRGLLTAFVCYHLLAVIVAPNKDTYLGHSLWKPIEPYVNGLEFSSSWGFFAPEPGPPPLFVEWELFDGKGFPIGQETWPGKGTPFFFRERQNRRITFARFLVSQDAHTEKVLTPYLCKSDSRVRSLKLWRLANLIPGLTEVRDGKRQIGDDINQTRHWVVHNFCPEAPEVAKQ